MKTVVDGDKPDPLLELLQSSREEERLQALRGLSDAPAADFLQILCRAMGDESWRVRKEAAELYLSRPWREEKIGHVIRLLYSQDNAGLRNTAAEVLVGLGRLALVPLRDELHSPDHDVRKFVLDILGEIGEEASVPAILNLLDDPDDNVRAAAAENLGKIRSASAIPALLKAMERPDLLQRFSILEALGRIGREVPVDQLTPFLKENILRKALFDCLGRVGDGAAVRPLIEEGLSDSARQNRETAVLSLCRLAHRFPAEVRSSMLSLKGRPEALEIANLLDGGTEQVRLASMTLLGYIGDGSFAPSLLLCLDREEEREKAVKVILEMGSSATSTLMASWPQSEDHVRAAMAFFFGKMECRDSIPLLLDGLDSRNPELQGACCQALGVIGDPGVLKGLISCLARSQVEVQELALQAICRIGERFGMETAAILRPLTEHDQPELRMAAVTVLGRVGGTEEDFTFALKDESALVRAAAIRAMEGRTGENVLASLELALTDEDPEVRRLTVEALGSSDKAHAALELALGDEDIWVRAAAVRALGRLEGDEAVASIRKTLKDPVGLVVIAAIETLQERVPDATFPILLDFLGHFDPEVVTTALRLLETLGRQDWIDGYVAPLLNHPDWEVRVAFARILVQMKGEESRLFLEDRLQREREELVRQSIQNLLESFQG